MESIILEIPGKPIAKKRPRFARRGKFVTTYSDQETEEGKFLLLALQQIGDRKPLEGPITISAEFFMPIPKSTSKKKTLLMEAGTIQHTKKPDIDNLIKFPLDVLNGVLWKDDSQVVSIFASKNYSLVPMTKILVRGYGETKKL